VSAREAVVAIRAALKARGWNQRKVSVRVRPCTYSSAISATIYDASVPLAEVKAIVDQHRHVRRCEITGDILEGGNTYTDVEYELGVLDPLTAEITARIEKGEQEIRGYTVVFDCVYERWTAYGNSDDLQTFVAYSHAEMARSLAIRTAGRA